MKYKIDSLEDMEEFAIKLIGLMKKGDVYGLIGDLGAGKTTLVSLICKNLSYPGVVNSPTFSLANIYETDPQINHLDLYRLEAEEDIESFEYEEYFYPENSVSFIEWPLKARSYLPRDIIFVKINYDNFNRSIEIENKDFLQRMEDM